MIERFYLKEYLSFKELELEFDKGLVVFTGPSGSGKSILMNAILSSFAQADADAAVCESNVNWTIDEDQFGIENESLNIFKQVRKEKTRYFVNNQSVSKKSIKLLCQDSLRHLSLKDYSDFDSANMLDFLDIRVGLKKKNFPKTLLKYKESYIRYKEAQKELHKLEDEEKKIIELKEFAQYEIAKIDEIGPTTGEDEELMRIKKELSKKEKISEQLQDASSVFNYEQQVSSALELLEIDSAFFDDAMNTLRSEFDSATERMNDLEDVNVEEVLDRIEAIAGLRKRHGSIEEALNYRDERLSELARYENIEITKDDLEKEVKSLHRVVDELAQSISLNRLDEIKSMTKDLNGYLSLLYLRDAAFILSQGELTVSGCDTLNLELQGISLQKISAGEFNRLRLALLALKTDSMGDSSGVLMLDEIDANLSGEESMSVAKVLRHLSAKFQIFVISHQPQLTSMGDQHVLVYKDKHSQVKILNKEERSAEIARMISGEDVTDEAKRFADELLVRAECVS